MNKNINIPGRLHSVATDGQVAGANEIYDDEQQKFQGEINAELHEEMEGTKEVVGSFDDRVKAIEDLAEISIEGGEVQVANTAEEIVAGSGKVPTANAVAPLKENILLGAVYDVSVKNPTAGPNNDGKWESLSALLSDANLNILIPTSVRKGGMSIKFVQSSDNKYVQYRLIKNTWSAVVTDWYNVEDDVDYIMNDVGYKMFDISGTFASGKVPYIITNAIVSDTTCKITFLSEAELNYIKIFDSSWTLLATITPDMLDGYVALPTGTKYIQYFADSAYNGKTMASSVYKKGIKDITLDTESQVARIGDYLTIIGSWSAYNRFACSFALTKVLEEQVTLPIGVSSEKTDFNTIVCWDATYTTRLLDTAFVNSNTYTIPAGTKIIQIMFNTPLGDGETISNPVLSMPSGYFIRMSELDVINERLNKVEQDIVGIAGSQTYIFDIYLSSSEGDDVNGDGTIDNPYKTVPPNIWRSDFILHLKRGDVFYELFRYSNPNNQPYDAIFKTRNRFKVVPYGSGSRPVLDGSAKIINSSAWVRGKFNDDTWSAVQEGEEGDVWRISLTDENNFYGYPVTKTRYTRNVAALIDNVTNEVHGRMKMRYFTLETLNGAPAVDIAQWNDTKESILTDNWDFYVAEDPTDNNENFEYLYLKLNTNPNNCDISVIAGCFGTDNCSNYSINGIEFRNLGKGGIQGSGSNIVTTDCVFRNIGGSLQENVKLTGFGNGVNVALGGYDTESGIGTKNVTVENCIFDNIFDTAVSFQSGTSTRHLRFEDISFRNNVIYNARMVFEFFNGSFNDDGGAAAYDNDILYKNCHFAYNKCFLSENYSYRSLAKYFKRSFYTIYDEESQEWVNVQGKSYEQNIFTDIHIGELYKPNAKCNSVFIHDNTYIGSSHVDCYMQDNHPDNLYSKGGDKIFIFKGQALIEGLSEIVPASEHKPWGRNRFMWVMSADDIPLYRELSGDYTSEIIIIDNDLDANLTCYNRLGEIIEWQGNIVPPEHIDDDAWQDEHLVTNIVRNGYTTEIDTKIAKSRIDDIKRLAFSAVND